MKKNLIIVPNNDFYFFNSVNIKDCDVLPIYPYKMEKHKRLLLKFPFLINIFFNKKINNEYSKIIVFDIVIKFFPDVLKIICKNHPNSKIIIYSWNILEFPRDRRYLSLIQNNKFIEKYCYDLNECEKYNCHFNTIMYDFSFMKNFKKDHIELKYDILFLGFSKSRELQISSFLKKIKVTNLKCKIIFIGDNLANQVNNESVEFKNKKIPYSEYLKILFQSKAILDINQENQIGLSLRFMEALAFNKKIITTNRDFLNTNYKESENVFLIDNDFDVNELLIFMQKENVVNEDLNNYYSIESWVSRFE